jgi:tRNA-2-methylthio-N6-dimethylallyladenosine synthase
MIIAVAGCVAQAEGAEIMRRAPIVDLVVGPQSYHILPELIFKTQVERRQLLAIEFPEDDKFRHLPPRARESAPTAFLTVQEGCDKFCTFCVVPYTRGPEVSRPIADLEEEARRLVAGGAKEITLLGQNVNAFAGALPGGGRLGLAGLLARLAAIEGLERLRYVTSHPRDMSAELIEAHRANAKLMPYLHLPFQAGSDRVLATMNRKHTAGEYLAIVDRVRQTRPDMAISTDIIVGFPGETEEDFAATLDVVRAVGFASAYAFKYSPRPGTPAANMGDQVAEDVKTRRLHELQHLLNDQQGDFNRGCVGRTLPILFEAAAKRAGTLVGRSPYMQWVHVEADASLLGHVVPVEIKTAGLTRLTGVTKSSRRSTNELHLTM